MTYLTYRASDSAAAFLPCLRQAAGVWNDVLSDLVHLREWVPPSPCFSTTVSDACNIVVTMDYTLHPFGSGKLGDGRPIRNAKNPTRVAQCQRIATDYWQITLSADVKWATSAWARFWGRGENALACLVHELGHVFKLPHASDPTYIMHPEIGGRGKLSRREKEHYRTHFLQMLEAED